MRSTTHFGRYWAVLTITSVAVIGAMSPMPVARADNTRLNNSVVANVYTIQHQAGCTNNVAMYPALQLAAQWHTDDVLKNRALDGDIGSDGSTPKTGPTRRDSVAA